MLIDNRLPGKVHELINQLDEMCRAPVPPSDEQLLSPDPALMADYLKKKGKRELVDHLLYLLNRPQE